MDKATMRTKLHRASLRSLRADTYGGAAIEFGLLAPLLMLMLLGTIELGRAIANNRHFVAAVTTAGDLVSREEYLGASASEAESNLGGIMLSTKHMLAPYDASKLKLAVFSVKASDSDAKKAKVEWSYSYNGMEAPAQCSDYTLPDDIVSAGGSVIVVDAAYTFTSLFGSYVPGMSPSMQWTEKSYYSPRNSCVDLVEGDNCISKC